MVATVSSIEALEKEIKRREALFKRLLLQEIKARLQSGEFILSMQERVIAIIRGLQSAYFSGIDDPTDPTNFEGLIRAEVARQINMSARQLKVGQSSFNLTVLSDAFLGLDTGGPTSPSDATPMRWMAYFIMGDFDDNLYWVPAAAANALNMQDQTGSLGRFGSGFLITPAGGSDSIKRKNTDLATLGVAEKIVKHPQSGKAGNPALFKGVISNTHIEEAILKPALAAALKKLES